MTKNTMVNSISNKNARNTFEELLRLGVIPVVNENDTVSTYELQFGDNDRLSAIVTALINADLLILLSDIDGLFTDDPNTNPNALCSYPPDFLNSPSIIENWPISGVVKKCPNLSVSE